MEFSFAHPKEKCTPPAVKSLNIRQGVCILFRLTDKEWNEIKKHPEAGYRIAQATSELMPISEYILAHHERWDGKGYPQGLKGEEK